MKTLGIYGSGGLGREILDLIKAINRAEQQFNPIFINDFKDSNTAPINGVTVLTFDEFKAQFSPEAAAIAIAVGEPKVRRIMREKVTAAGYKLQTLIHPGAFIGSETKLGDGVLVQYNTFVSCNLNIGDNTLIQPNSNIGHDTIIGGDSVISTFVVISGNCNIGECVYIGVGTPIKEKITIGSHSIIGMGSAVLRDIPENVVALGNPARPMKENTEGKVFH